MAIPEQSVYEYMIFCVWHLLVICMCHPLGSTITSQEISLYEMLLIILSNNVLYFLEQMYMKWVHINLF